MIQIDMNMPKTCCECPFYESTIKYCPILPGIPAWHKELSSIAHDKRSDHCPLKEVKKDDPGS